MLGLRAATCQTRSSRWRALETRSNVFHNLRWEANGLCRLRHAGRVGAIPIFAEPFFMELDAEVTFAPAMNATEDLQKGLSGIG